MMGWADLHLHSNCSDGGDPPERVMARAAELGIIAAALTDHDTVAGLAAARAAAETAGVAFLNGVEISASFETQEIHILGLGIEMNAPVLARLLAVSHEGRLARIDDIIERLDRFGVASRSALQAQLGGAGLSGRMHVAVALKGMGKAATVQKAFERFLNRGGPGYVPKSLPTALDAIDAIHGANGLAFVAHPGLGHTLRRRLGALLELPFDGIEAWHVSHTPAMTSSLRALALDRGLLVTGGSDCHGDIKGEKPTMGRVKAPHACYERIVEALAARNRALRAR